MSDDGDYLTRLVDQERLRTYLEAELYEVETFLVQRHAEGHSNETLYVTFGDRELVLRRPPPGEIAESAHDVLREYRIVDALQETNVPVPPTVLSSTDHSIIGSDFYVMEKVKGDVFRSNEPKWVNKPTQRQRIGYELVDKLARIHAVDFNAVGLANIGNPSGYTERQVSRWQQQLEWALEVTSDDREVPALHRVSKWLRVNVPDEGAHTLVHGDYKLDNVMYAPDTDPEIVSILDWEMSTLGDPALDLAWILVHWRDSGDPAPAVPELTPMFTDADGYPTRTDLVSRYERETGNEFKDQRFYRTLAVFKLAALGEMFYRRHLEDNADDPLYPAMEDGVPRLADRAQRIIQGEEPL